MAFRWRTCLEERWGAFRRTEGKKRGKGEPKAEENLHGCGKAQKQERRGELRLGGLGALGGCFYLYLKGYNGAKKVRGIDEEDGGLFLLGEMSAYLAHELKMPPSLLSFYPK